MAARQLQHRHHLPALGAGTDQRGIAAAAEGQRQSVEENRLAGAGLAGEDVEALAKFDADVGEDGEIGNA